VEGEILEKIKITTEYIKLEQMMKFANLAQSGSDAKNIIRSGEVKVNGIPELQRGKKLRPGDIVSYEGKEYIIE